MSGADPAQRAVMEAALRRQGYDQPVARKVATRILRGTKVSVDAAGNVRGSAEFSEDEARQLLTSLRLIDRIPTEKIVDAARCVSVATRYLTPDLAVEAMVVVHQSPNPYRALRKLATAGES